MSNRTILIRPDGRVEYIGDDGAGLVSGRATKRRASHIEPAGRWRRLAFRVLRGVFADESRVAAWTRRWRGPWMVRVIGGPVAGPFENREAAIAWEVAWLREYRAPTAVPRCRTNTLVSLAIVGLWSVIVTALAIGAWS